MDFDKVISAYGDQEGIMVNSIVFEDAETITIESKRYFPDDDDFAWAVDALDYFASQGGLV